MSKTPAYLVQLHSALDERLRPETVLAVISRGRPSAIPEELRQGIRQAGSRGGSLHGYTHYWTSMSEDFARPIGATRQLLSAAKAFGHPVQHVHTDPDQPADVRRVVEDLATEVGGNGRKLTRAARKVQGIELSRRAYRRQWRAMRRLQHKAERLSTEQRKRELTIVGRTGFVTDISLERFAACPKAAHFIAYWVARKNLRRQFSLSGKMNPMDTVAQWLLRACVDSEDPIDWAMIAMVCPNIGILKMLTPEEVGNLLGRWYEVMRECAVLLKTAWPKDIDKLTMVVQRGQNSSTWNTLAQAYNTARSSWLACISALGAEEMLDVVCPGKVMRMMAADLARWHSSTGSDWHPDSRVWNWLPMPWDVLDGSARCSWSVVAWYCEAAGIDPQASGWTAPKPPVEVAPFQLTPELVHGVTVASPEWASLLRRAGVFSGKRLSQDASLVADAVGGVYKGVVLSELPEEKVAPGYQD